MFLAYFDESGDSGVPGIVPSPTNYFVLSCVLVHQDVWFQTLNHLIQLRGWLRTTYGIPARPEIKSTDLRRGRGVIRPLGMNLDQRMDLFRTLIRWQNTTLPTSQVFAIAINKAPAHSRGWEPRLAAWTFAIQRLDKLCQEKNDKAIVFPDEGHGMFIRRLMRRLRRRHMIPGFFGRQTLSIPTERIIEDPNDRHSHDSYFIQLADWNAYAVHRSRYIDPRVEVPDDLWDELHDLHRTNVNRLTGGPPGIVLYPRP
ncbi:MAG: DUF3800 domain-containing protein [Gemmataceae bacterium]